MAYLKNLTVMGAAMKNINNDDDKGEYLYQQLKEDPDSFINQKELKPCPFCGGEVKYKFFNWAKKDYDKRGSHIACENEDCNVRPRVWETSKAKAIKAWNTRVSE